MIYRLSSAQRPGGQDSQEVYDWRAARWESTDLLTAHLNRRDAWLNRLDFEKIVRIGRESHQAKLSMKEMVVLHVEHTEFVGQKVEEEYQFGEIRESLPWVLDALAKSGQRWVIILETTADPARYVQVLITSTGSMWAECVSNSFLAGDECLDENQCEILPTLGWEWPGPPAFPNWHLHDELLNAGGAIASLMSRTLRDVFGVSVNDEIRLVTLALVEHEELADW
jgi:hypothetical protein